MITQYRFLLTGTEPLRPSDAYRLYGWLLQQIPEEFGAFLHQQNLTPISQHLAFDRANSQTIWTVSLLGQFAAEQFGPILDALDRIELHTDTYRAHFLDRREYTSVREIITAADTFPAEKRITLQFCSPYQVTAYLLP